MNRSSFVKENQESGKDCDEYVDYKYRWLIILLFFAPSVMNSIGSYIFSSISSELVNVYGESQVVVTLVLMSSMILFPFINFPCNYILGRSLQVGVLLGSTFVIIGSWIRILINSSLWWAIFGQFISSLGSPFFLNAPAQIASTWFKPHERYLATTILALIGTVGAGFGFMFPVFFVTTSTTDSTDILVIQQNNDAITNEIYNMLFLQALITSVISAPIFIFFREKPPTPPSHSAKQEKIAYSSSFKSLFKTKDYIVILIIMSGGLGNLNALAGLIGFYLPQFSFSTTDISYYGVNLVVGSLIGSFVIGTALQKTNHYKKILTIICCVSCFISVCVTASFWTESLVCVYFAAFFFAFFTTPLLPICFDYGCEVSFPVPEQFSCGISMSVMQIVVVILVLISTYFVEVTDKKTSLISCIIGIGVQFFSLFSRFFFKGDLIRQQHEKQRLLDKTVGDLSSSEESNID